MSKELIRLHDLCMAFDDELVLDHINLYINDSEFLTLLGPSGCGKTIVISGNFSISRDAMKELIAAHGGKCTSGVTGSTSFLLAGTKPGPEKLAKCSKLGIPVIGEDEFRSMLPPDAAEPVEETQLSLF